MKKLTFVLPLLSGYAFASCSDVNPENLPEYSKCVNQWYDESKAGLQGSYEFLLESTDRKQHLKTAQILWRNFVEHECAPTGNTLDEKISAKACLADKQHARALELYGMAPHPDYE